MKTFVIGDIHGAHKALVQCLERSSFNRDVDLLITLGDICDGWPYVKECVDELLTIKNRIDIVGNHDEWFKHWLFGGTHPDPLGAWVQGGAGTVKSYLRDTLDRQHMIAKGYAGYVVGLIREDVPESHRRFFEKQVLYYKDDKRNAFFVHAGFDRYFSISENKSQHPMQFYWDRTLWEKALSCKSDQKLATVDQFDEIFIGHTTCFKIGHGKSVQRGGVTNLDTGAGWEGVLTIMDIDTKEEWQSDLVTDLYPEIAATR